jgi:hypothetical protein
LSQTRLHSGKCIFSQALVIFALLSPFLEAFGQSGDGGQQNLDLNAIVSRMEQARTANLASFKPYSAVREYNLYGSSEADRKSHVVARVDFVPPTQKDFTIEKTEGSDRGAMIVRRLLENESNAARDAKCPGAFIPANYDFQLVGRDTLDGHPVWVLRLKPRHQETDLIDGMAYVDQSTFLLRRVEGDLAKNPSWWIKKVHTVLEFGNQHGMWLQTTSRSTAQIRMIGPHTLTATTVSLETAAESAKSTVTAAPQNNAAPAHVRRRRSSNPSVALGSSVIGR